MMDNVVISIDPGLDGAVVFFVGENEPITCKRSLGLDHILVLFRSLNTTKCKVAIEHVKSFGPGYDLNSQWVLAEDVGMWAGICLAVGIPKDSIYYVNIQAWKRYIGLKKYTVSTLFGESHRNKLISGRKKLHKSVSIMQAQASYPMIKIEHDGIADAINIGRYFIDCMCNGTKIDTYEDKQTKRGKPKKRKRRSKLEDIDYI